MSTGSKIWLKPKRQKLCAIALIGRQPDAGQRQALGSLAFAVRTAARIVHNGQGRLYATVTHGNLTITIPQNRF